MHISSIYARECFIHRKYINTGNTQGIMSVRQCMNDLASVPTLVRNDRQFMGFARTYPVHIRRIRMVMGYIMQQYVGIIAGLLSDGTNSEMCMNYLEF